MIKYCKSILWNYFFFTKNKRSIKWFSRNLLKHYNGSENKHYLNKEKKILFIHNPKTAGNTIKEILNLNKRHTTHVTPSFLIPKSTWESYKTIVSVRNPLDRLISSYNYHTNPSYNGYYASKFPNLHMMNLEAYFNIMKKEPFAIRPQVEYTKHLLSIKKIDFIIRYEYLEKDIKILCQEIDLKYLKLPHLNYSSEKRMTSINDQKESLKKNIFKFYKEDFETFNYSR